MSNKAITEKCIVCQDCHEVAEVGGVKMMGCPEMPVDKILDVGAFKRAMKDYLTIPVPFLNYADQIQETTP